MDSWLEVHVTRPRDQEDGLPTLSERRGDTKSKLTASRLQKTDVRTDGYEECTHVGAAKCHHSQDRKDP